MSYPKSPGWKGNVSTGRDGARQFEPKVGKRQREVLDALQAGPMSADQVAKATGRHWYLTRPRVSELKRLGLVVETGARLPSEMGGFVHVVRLATHEEQESFAAKEDAGV